LDTLLYSCNHASQKSFQPLVQRNPFHLYQVSYCTECPEYKTLGTCKFVLSAYYVPSVDAQTFAHCFFQLKVSFVPSVVGLEYTVQYIEHVGLVSRNGCLSSVSLVPSVEVTEHST
jgi:hypothetical protein